MPLWASAITQIKNINPDTVVMGQITEYSTSRIGLFCYENGINLVLNASEVFYSLKELYILFSVNHEYFNSDIIDLQVIPNSICQNYVMNNDEIKNKEKYKRIGVPRFDLNINMEFNSLEVPYLRKKYGINRNQRVFLYMSSFIYDEFGGQVDPENYDIVDPNKRLEKDRKEKAELKKILTKLISKLDDMNALLLIKKHPWDKSEYFEENYQSKNVIIIDSFEQSAAVISICDYLLHAQSTTAVEAWIQNKKTISIQPFFGSNDDNLNHHMKYEIIVRNIDELIKVIEEYADNNTVSRARKILQPLDGKATIRLAREINKLKPKENKIIFMKPRNYNIVSMIKKINSLFHLPIRKTVNNKTIDKDTYGYLLRLYEKQRPFVEKLYEKHIQEYIKENIQLIKSKGK
jgi:surface carbohydrate biosynthesis protein